MPFTSETAHTGTQFKPGQSGNPAGLKPGTKHISTYIQKYLDKQIDIEDVVKGKYKAVRMEILIGVAFKRAEQGDQRWADWLAKYGYGTKVQLGNDPDNPLNPVRELTDEELRARYQQIIGSGQAGTISDSSGDGSTPSQG